MKTPKLHWVDLGIWPHLTGHWGPLDGFAFESYVAIETMTLLRTRPPGARLMLHRTRNGREVDLIVECERGTIGIELQMAGRVESSDAPSLRRVALEFAASWRVGLVVGRRSRLHQLGGRIWAVSSTALLG